MKKLKFPEDFFAYDNPDCPDKDIEKAVNKMKNWMKGETCLLYTSPSPRD